MKILLPVAVLFCGAVVVAVLIKSRPKAKPEAREVIVPVVRAISVAPGSHQFKVHAQGSVAPRTEINLVSEVPGRVTAISPSFAAGGFFEAGDVLVTLDARDFALALTRAKAALAEAKVRLQREEAEGEVARKEWQALGKGEPNPLLLRLPQLAEARATIESAQAQVQQAELDLARCQIKAPFPGRVWSKRVDIGQFVNKGEVLGRLYAVDYAEVRLPLPLDETVYLDLPLDYRGETREKKGPEVTLRARFGSQTHEWQGIVHRVEGEIDPRTRMVTAVVRVENPYGRGTNQQRPPLAVGLFVDAEIMGRAVDQVVIVPRIALRGRNEIIVIDAQKQLRFRPVEVVRLEGESVVLRNGLQPSDLVCISPLETVVDGMKVRIADKDGLVTKSEL